MDHIGDDLEVWFNSGSDVRDNVIQDEDNMEKEPQKIAHVFEGIGLEDEIIPDDLKINLNKTYADEFLNKLCSDAINDEEEDNEDCLFHPIFNVCIVEATKACSRYEI
ncbi:unnamed protein product [Lactuca virosa]|uniref:Uncharacterized protein n=1 Tax=Lactuca virosa TaxID=75947 RepID=A0AAU9M240_9ASTR|nr:unnamed protein product [Lactuca virosa]